MALVFGSPEAQWERRRIAAMERLEGLATRTYQVSGEITFGFDVTVEARTQNEACAKVHGMYPHDLCAGVDDIDIHDVHDAGLANPDDPEEQAKERRRLERAGEAVPAQRLV